MHYVTRVIQCNHTRNHSTGGVSRTAAVNHVLHILSNEVWSLGLPCVWVLFSADLPFSSCLLQCTRSLRQDSCNQRTNTIERGSSKSHCSLVKNVPVFHGIRRLVTIFSTARHSSLSRSGVIQSMSNNPIYMIHFNTALSYELRSYEWFFRSPFPIKFLCVYLSSPMRSTWTVHLVLPDLISRSESMELVIIPLSPASYYSPTPTSYTSPITLSIFRYKHLLPRLSTTILRIPNLSLAIRRNSDVSFIESFIETSLSQFVFHCVSAHKFWLRLISFVAFPLRSK
jgi:hypothetical protein